MRNTNTCEYCKHSKEAEYPHSLVCQLNPPVFCNSITNYNSTGTTYYNFQQPRVFRNMTCSHLEVSIGKLTAEEREKDLRK